MAKSPKRPQRSKSKKASRPQSDSRPKTKQPGPLDRWKPALTHVGILVVFLALLFGYFSPLLEGKVIRQGDIQQYNGMATEVRSHYEETGENATWTNSQFSGMPSYHVGLKYPGNLMMKVKGWTFLGLPQPVKFVFLLFVGFYVLMLALDMGPWMSALGALMYAFSSYFFIILEAGHTSKAAALCFVAPTIAGIILAYRGKLLLGAVLTALALSLNLASNHFQITYYLAITIVIIGAAFMVEAIMKKKLVEFGKSTGVLVLAALLAVGPSLSLMWTSQEYAKDTIRGPRELTPPKGEDLKGDGLDIDYALRWSYGIDETFSLLIPNFMGGASGGKVDPQSEAARQLGTNVLPTYWGDQPFTSGPVYVGAIVCFLFVLGLFIVDGPLMWGLLAATLLSFILAWGRHVMGFTEFIFYNIPLYNKFRAVAMTLVIAEFTMPLLGLIGLHRFLNREKFGLSEKRVRTGLYVAAAVTGGLALFWWLIGPSMLEFSGRGDQRYQPQVVEILKDVRIDLLQTDALRALGLVLAAAALLWFYLRDTIKGKVVLGVLVGLSLLDMWTVNKRYLDNEAFVAKSQVSKPRPSPADQAILNAPNQDLHYRVFNVAGVDPNNPGSWQGPFNESKTSYFHKSVGGYHAAKLRRYQDMIDRHIMAEMLEVLSPLVKQAPDSVLRAALANAGVLNMLNTKYFIVNPGQRPLENPYAFGNAWFVNELQRVESPDAEIEALNQIDPAETAVIDNKKFGEYVEGYEPTTDPDARIRLTEYKPHQLTYEASASKEQLVVFSEVYYDGGEKGWQAYIDGKPAPHFRVDYILRAMRIPAGQNMKIEFRMEPRSYLLGETISLITSILLILAVVAVVGMEIRKIVS
jgi:hypothetical protein